jgi:hypothetical protein
MKKGFKLASTSTVACKQVVYEKKDTSSYRPTVVGGGSELQNSPIDFVKSVLGFTLILKNQQLYNTFVTRLGFLYFSDFVFIGSSNGCFVKFRFLIILFAYRNESDTFLHAKS